MKTTRHCNARDIAGAFAIMAKYSNDEHVTQVEHGQIWGGLDIDIHEVSVEDKKKLAYLGWVPAEEGGFHKYI